MSDFLTFYKSRGLPEQALFAAAAVALPATLGYAARAFLRHRKNRKTIRAGHIMGPQGQQLHIMRIKPDTPGYICNITIARHIKTMPFLSQLGFRPQRGDISKQYDLREKIETLYFSTHSLSSGESSNLCGMLPETAIILSDGAKEMIPPGLLDNLYCGHSGYNKNTDEIIRARSEFITDCLILVDTQKSPNIIHAIYAGDRKTFEEIVLMNNGARGADQCIFAIIACILVLSFVISDFQTQNIE